MLVVFCVVPCFPVVKNSRRYRDCLPLGLLRVAGLFRSFGRRVVWVEGDVFPEDVVPSVVFVATSFTYWSSAVFESIGKVRELYGWDVPVVVGGVLASLMPDLCRRNGADVVVEGVVPALEKVQPAYDIIDLDFQVLHASRGCIRKCDFCGVKRIEPDFTYKKTIKDEICMRDIVFYDNNFLANPYVEDILDELIELKRKHVIRSCVAQCGLDGRILREKPHLAFKFNLAGFKQITIAWDSGIQDKELVKEEIDILCNAGYKPHNLAIFMIYNFNIPFSEMEEKRVCCFNWGVQIRDCRYRPLNATFDNYNGHKRSQTGDEYYIHPMWTDEEVRAFRRNCRKTSICSVYEKKWHSARFGKKKYSREIKKMIEAKPLSEVKQMFSDVYDPSVVEVIEKDKDIGGLDKYVC